MLVRKDEKSVMGTFIDGKHQAAFQFLAKDYFLFTHDVFVFFALQR